MQKYDLFAMSPPNAMLYSRIQPQLNQKNNQNQYITHKIPKADKKNLESYQTRARIVHPNVIKTYIQQKSTFYHSIYIEKCKELGTKDMLMLPINKRNMLLAEILAGVKILSKLYGYFYITEKMLGFSSTGRLTVWINQNCIDNRRSYPINHGKISQDIFVSDFKAGFGGNLRELRQFKRVKSVDDLIALLSRNNGVAHSVYLSEPAHRQSHIHPKQSVLTASDLDYRESFSTLGRGSKQKQFIFPESRGLKKTQSLNSLRKPISFSYLPNELEKSLIRSSKIIPQRALTSSVSMQSLHLRRPQHDSHLFTSNGSLKFSKILGHSSSMRSLSKSIIPKIQFSYNKPETNEGWKKKPNTFSKNEAIVSQSMMKKSQSLTNVAFQASQTHHKQPLKVSFPHTTAHTFTPFASNGNISLAFKESANLGRKGLKLNKQDLQEDQNNDQRHISEDSNEVQMDLDVLFSDDEELQSREQAQQLEMIMEEFENVLLS